MTRKYLRYLILFILTLPAIGVKSATPLGGEMSYRHISGDKYEIKTIIYRDCRGSALNTNNITFGVYGGLNGAKSCSTYSLTFTRTKIEDISPVCSTASKPCSPQNTAASAGTEAHTFLDTIDFSSSPYSGFKSSSCCEVTFYASMCCRSNSLTTGGASSDFYITATINLCNLSNCNTTVNSSAEWTLPPFFRYCNNQSVQYSNGLADTFDHDRMVIKTVAPITALPATTMTYANPFSFQYPLTPYCIPSGTVNCTPNPKTTPARGFSHDTLLDLTIFTPTSAGENATLAYECIEYRRDKNKNWVWIGKIRREFVIVVKDDCGYTKSPIITGPTINSVCGGDKICFQVAGKDETFTPNQTVPDTVNLTWNGTIKKGSFSVTNPKDREKTADFCWTTKVADVSEIPYRFTSIVSDQHCDIPQINRMVHLVYVNKQTKGKMSGNVAKCDDIEYSIIPDSADAGAFTHTTVLRNRNFQSIANSTARNGSFANLDSGTYYLTTTLTQAGKCSVTLLDTIQVNKSTACSIVGSNSACKNTFEKYVANTSNTLGSIAYSWSLTKNGPGIGTADTFMAYNHSKLHLSIIDGQNCKANDSIVIQLLDLPVIAWTQKPLNAICSNAAPVDLTSKIASPAAYSLSKGLLNMWGQAGLNSPNGLVENLSGNQFRLNPALLTNNAITMPVTEKIYLQFTDSNGCISRDSNSIRVNPSPVVELIDKTFCQNINSDINLDQFITRPKNKFGAVFTWTIQKAPVGVNTAGMLNNPQGNDWNFNPGTPGDNQKAGKYTLVLQVMDAVSACKNTDTAILTLSGLPSIVANSQNSYCQHQTASLDLYNQITVDNTKPSAGTAFFNIVSINGNFDSTAWPKNIITDSRYFKLNSVHGDYQIKVKSLETGCESVSTFALKIKPTPKSNFGLTPKDSAEISSPIFTVQNNTTIGDNSALTYQWSYGDGNTSNAFAPTIQYSPVPAVYTIQLISNTLLGCSDTASRQVIVFDKTAATKNVQINTLRFDNMFRLNMSNYNELELWIFDSNGKLVHHTWNNEGIELSPGIYSYMASIGKTGTNPIILKGKHIIQ